MSDEKKISDDELVEIAGGGVVIDLNQSGVSLDERPEVIGITPGEEKGGGSITPNPEDDPDPVGQGGSGGAQDLL